VRELDTILAEVDAALRELRAGKSIALAGLEARIESMCQGIASLPRDQGRACGPKLLDLVAALDAITQNLSQASDAAPQGPAGD
jgi:hypothetical protein